MPLRLAVHTLSLIITLFVLVAACGCGKKSTLMQDDPVRVARDRNAPQRDRLQAAKIALDRAKGDELALNATQDALDEVLWALGEAPALRAKLIRELATNPDERVVARTRRTLADLLPREPSAQVIAAVCELSAGQRWEEMTAPIVRSYSRTGIVGLGTDALRPERAALAALHPKTPIERVVYQQFLNPPASATGKLGDWQERVQRDAWGLLARLDATGGVRTELLGEDLPADVPPIGKGAVEALRTAKSQLRVLPESAGEFAWLLRLFGDQTPAGRTWWTATARAVRQVPSDTAIRLRHLEAVRWASEHRPAWLASDRASLVTSLALRTDGREVRLRKNTEGAKYAQSLKEQARELTWADALCALILDESLRQPGVLERLLEQAAMDRANTTTEYGGAWERTGADPLWYVPVLYPPRPGQRPGDMVFVAPEDMAERTDTALAHYHFHAQAERNDDYAGPSPGDLNYARETGRTCLVLTSVGAGKLNADVYGETNGRPVVLDLGVLQIGAKKQ
jgi:hypothetical protein